MIIMKKEPVTLTISPKVSQIAEALSFGYKSFPVLNN